MENKFSNESERFWLFLLDNKKNFFEKKEILEEYRKFEKNWNFEGNFDKTFDNLRKTKRLIFLFDKKWAVLNLNDVSVIKSNKSELNKIILIKIFEYFEEEKINAYFGLNTADYFNQLIWQSLHTYYIINDKYNKEKKIENEKFIFVKFPKQIIINPALKTNENYLKHSGEEKVKYSDEEKTLIDKIFYLEQLKKKINIKIPESLDFQKLKMYLTFYKKYPLVRTKLISLLDEEQLKQIK